MADHYLLFAEATPLLTAKEYEWFGAQLAPIAVVDGQEVPERDVPAGKAPTWHGLRFLRDFGPEDSDGSDCDWAGFEYVHHHHDGQRYVTFYSEDHAEMDRLVHLMQTFLCTFRQAESWSLIYATTCSKPRIGEFGGGAFFVTAQTVEWYTLADFIDRQRQAFDRRRQMAV